MPDYSSFEVGLDDVLVSACGSVYDHWMSLKSGDHNPTWRDVDLSAFAASVIPFLRVVDVIDGGAGFRYRFWGTGLSDIFGLEQTGRCMSDDTYWPLDGSRSECAAVVASGSPVGFKRRLTASVGEQEFRPLEVVGIRLPLSSNGNGVDHILSYSDFGNARRLWKAALADLRPAGAPAR